MGYCISHTLSGITTDCNGSLGGIKKAYIALFADNMYTADASGNSITGVSSASSWYEYNFRKESGNFTSTLNVDSSNGINYISTEINLVFSRMEAAKRLEMKALSLDDLCVVIVDSNGKYYAFGENEPVNASAGTGETGTAKSDGNKYTITLKDDSASWPKMLTEDGITSLLARVQS